MPAADDGHGSSGFERTGEAEVGVAQGMGRDISLLLTSWCSLGLTSLGQRHMVCSMRRDIFFKKSDALQWSFPLFGLACSGMMVQDPNRRRRGGRGACLAHWMGSVSSIWHASTAQGPVCRGSLRRCTVVGVGEGEGVRSPGRDSVWVGQGTPLLLPPLVVPLPQQLPPDTSRRRRRPPRATWFTCTATDLRSTTGP